MKMFAGKAMLTVLSTLGMKEGDDLEHPMLSRSVEKAQRKVEERNFQMRKNILEYDEPMEHQRRSFYGLRQPIVEGRGVRELVLRYVGDSIDKAADDFLGPKHVPNTIAEWVRENCGVSIEADRFMRKDRDEIERVIRVDAAEEAQEAIRAAAGECLPLELEPSEWDAEGFAAWARANYGAELVPEDIRAMDREDALLAVQRAAQRKFDDIDLSPVSLFLAKDFGATQLAHWGNRKFGIEISPAAFATAETPADAADILAEKARAAYREREINYPVDFAIETTNASMQQNPAGALAQFCAFVKARYGLDWSSEALPSTDPVELRRMLLERARAIGDSEIAARAQDCLSRGRDVDAIAAWFADECVVRLTETERADAAANPEAFVPAKLRDALRAELTQFERWVLLSILDEAWKNNLHSMDQIRDAIGFRAFSQKDPRIEFKRESARAFNEMQETVRDSVTDIAFRGRFAPPAARQPARPAAAPAMVPAGGGGGEPSAPAAPPQAAERVAQAAPVDPSTIPVVGRNEPCPCGSGLKYRQCHGKKPE
ncbi:MAG: SEC-C metal-binding domain-containing protein [Planctomycetota bacterium]